MKPKTTKTDSLVNSQSTEKPCEKTIETLKPTKTMNYNNLSKFFTVRNVLLAGAVILAIVIVLTGGCDDAGVLTAVILPGVAGGKHVEGEPLTVPLAQEASPELLRNEIDERIVKIRPMATPIDQISRKAGSRRCGSMVVDYYAVDTKPVETMLTEPFTKNTGKSVSGYVQATLSTDNDRMFEPSETIMVPDVTATATDGSTSALVLYVVSRDDSGIKVVAVNNNDAEGNYVVPPLEECTRLIRMGRAAAELDVQTAQFEAMPTKNRNYCQIFKAQVEQSIYMKIANKEVGWSFSDQEEAAIIDMRLGMEKNFLFGCRTRVFDPVKQNEIMLTGGIWYQAGRQFDYTVGALSYSRLIELMRKAFTGNGASSRKILIGGSGLIEQLNKLEHNKVIGASDTKTYWGLDFTEMVSKFGRLYVIHSEIFDQCGHENDGMVVDPEYITKYSHVPFRTERLNLRQSGVRNTDAIVITEASCLVLRYPDAHMRIVGSAPTTD